MTDHAQEAIDLLDELEISELDADELLLAAQAHATLAVAAELHTANLLALAQFDHTVDKGTRLYTDLEYSNVLRTRAFKALGLVDENGEAHA